LFLRFATGVRFCGALGAHLRLLGVDRVSLREDLPLIGQTRLSIRGPALFGVP
jgi:hypothetical protein